MKRILKEYDAEELNVHFLLNKTKEAEGFSPAISHCQEQTLSGNAAHCHCIQIKTIGFAARHLSRYIQFSV
jgi:hypothetical protein